MTSRSIGYARTSGGGDSKQAAGLEVQVKALKDAGCAAVFQEIVSTRTPENERHQLQAALNAVVEGDEIVVTALARNGRTQREVINRLHLLQEQGVHIRTLDGLVNTRALGKFAPVLIGLLTGLNEVEREVTRDRVLNPSSTAKQLVKALVDDRRRASEEGLVLRLREEDALTAPYGTNRSCSLNDQRIIVEQEAVTC